jgi:elongation factor 1 alpha-like protein
VEHDVLN